MTDWQASTLSEEGEMVGRVPEVVVVGTESGMRKVKVTKSLFWDGGGWSRSQ